MKREGEEEKLPVSLIWLENRRSFLFNSNASNAGTTATNNSANNNANTNANTPFITKAFHLNFIPSGRLSFLLISSDGSIDIFIENYSTDFDILKLKKADINENILMGSFAYQRPNGTILIFLRTRNYLTISQISDNFEIEIKLKREIDENILKFIWSESKESLIQLEGNGKCLKVSSYKNFSSTFTSKTIDLPFEIEITKNEEILHSSYAPNYLFLQSNSKILILNLNGEMVKQLYLEPEDGIAGAGTTDIAGTDGTAGIDDIGPLLISPNGLVVARISEKFDDFPIIIYSAIGEITLKSKTVNALCLTLCLCMSRYYNAKGFFG